MNARPGKRPLEQLFVVRAHVGEVSLVNGVSVGTQHVLKGPGRSRSLFISTGPRHNASCSGGARAMQNPTGERNCSQRQTRFVPGERRKNIFVMG